MRAVVLLNHRSRGGARPPLSRMLRAFRDGGWEAEIWAGEGSLWTLAAARRAAASGVDAIFGAGGDGMLAAMLPALVDNDTALGVVPLGTGNVWARELGLPLDPAAAITAQLQQPARRVDIGRLNHEPFLVVASAGLDARIVEVVESSMKGLGQAAYPLASLGLLGEVRGARCRVTLDGEQIELPLLGAVITNGRLYGGLVPLVPEARVDDGVLDVVLFEGTDPFQLAAHVARVLAGQHHRDANIHLCQARSINIVSRDRPLPLQADGDLKGTTPAEISVEARAVRALGVTGRGV
ncbi:MAG: diacylglycerol/lipid kinase family protein [Chloroflexota bacterium]